MKATTLSIALSLFGAALSAPVSDSAKDTEPSTPLTKDGEPALLYGSLFDRIGNAARLITGRLIVGDKNTGGLGRRDELERRISSSLLASLLVLGDKDASKEKRDGPEQRVSDEELASLLFGTFTPRLILGDSDLNKRDELERRISSSALASLLVLGDKDASKEKRDELEQPVSDELANLLFGTFTPRLLLGNKEAGKPAAKREELERRWDWGSTARLVLGDEETGEPTDEKREELEELQRRWDWASTARLVVGDGETGKPDDAE